MAAVWQNGRVSRTATGSGGAAEGAVPIAQMLREKGLRVTRPRVAVLELLVSTGRHLDAAAIVDHVRRQLDGVSVQAIYDVLAALTRTGLARQLEPHARPALFEARVGDNHHHLICRTCGDVLDLDCGADSKPC